MGLKNDLKRVREYEHIVTYSQTILFSNLFLKKSVWCDLCIFVNLRDLFMSIGKS